MIRVEVFNVNVYEVLETYEKDELLTEYQLKYNLIDNQIASKKYRDGVNCIRTYYNNKEIYETNT